MTTSIIDNSSNRGRLADLLNKELPNCDEISIATAYFNIRGFGAIKEALNSKEEQLVYKDLISTIKPLTAFTNDKPLKLLLGREPNEEIKWEEKILRELEKEQEDEEDNDEYYNLLQECVEYFENYNREVKIMQGKFFHGKCYIGKGKSNSIGVVGSSNFTYGGLVSNRELNMYTKDNDAVEDLYSWFIEQWNASKDYKEEFLSALKNYVTTYSPYDIIAKALYETYKDQIELGLEKDRNKALKNMYTHQFISFISAMQKLDKYNGVIIADSTGLGKTMVAMNIIHESQREGKRTILIAPKSILDTTWSEEMKRLKILLHKDDMLGMEYISHNPDKVLKELDDDNIGLVIVDEAHYFRNPSSNRHKVLKELLAKTRAKLVLLTATPVNTSLMDLYNLFSLYLPDDSISDITDKGLRNYFINQQTRWLEGNEIDMDDVLQRFMVRHSRQFAIAMAKAENKDIHFPKRVLNSIEYDMKIDYEGIWNMLDGIAFTFYDLAIERFSNKFKLPDGTIIKDLSMYKERLDNLKRLVKLIVKINIFKRLESSLYACNQTLDRIIDYINIAISYAKEKGYFIPPKMKGDILQLYDEEEDEEMPDPEEVFKDEEIISRCKLEDEEIDRFVASCIRDKEQLGQLQELLSNNKDYKFSTFITNIKAIYNNINENNGIIIFSQYYDTVSYLYNSIRNYINDNVMLVSGVECKDREGKHDDSNNIIKDFKKRGGILVTTDKLSAGQNLQNAQYVINYDFPWNPVVLIQRAGRVDRLGSNHNEVYLLNVLPTNRNPNDPSSLTHFISIFEKLNKRLMAINQTIGLDASQLGEHAMPKDFSIYAKIAANDQDIIRVLERKIEQFTNEPMDILAEIMADKGIDYLKKLPNGIGAYKRGVNKKGMFILFNASFSNGEEKQYWRLKFFDDKSVIKNAGDIIDIIMKGNSNNFGERIDYSTLLNYMRDMKDELYNEIKMGLKKKLTLGSVPIRANKTIKDIYDELSKVDEELAVKFRDNSNKPFIVDTLIKAKKEGKLVEKARDILTSINNNDDINGVSNIKIRRVCWCYLE